MHALEQHGEHRGLGILAGLVDLAVHTGESELRERRPDRQHRMLRWLDPTACSSSLRRRLPLRCGHGGHEARGKQHPSPAVTIVAIRRFHVVVLPWVQCPDQYARIPGYLGSPARLASIAPRTA